MGVPGVAIVIDAIDISEHQGAIDFDAVERAGIKLVVVKATEGRDFTDPLFEFNWRALQDRPGIARGAYHFARADSDRWDPDDAEVEALDFCQALERLGGYGPGEATCPWLDVERSGLTDDAAANESWIARWCEVVESRLARSPGIYAGHGGWADRLGNSHAVAHLPLWQADVHRPAGRPHEMGLRWPWSMHQHSHLGRVPGIRGLVDLDVVRDEPTLRRLIEMGVVERGSSPGSVMPRLDLSAMVSHERSEAVARVQGLMLAYGYGPDGLVGEGGRPDGKPGPKTRAALESFRSILGLGPGLVVDGAVWWELLRS